MLKYVFKEQSGCQTSRKMNALTKPQQWLFVDFVSQGPKMKYIQMYDKHYNLVKKGEKDYKLMSDSCPHRGVSLSKCGELKGNFIKCGYHGRCFDLRKDLPSVSFIKTASNCLWADVGSIDLVENSNHILTEPPYVEEISDKYFRTISYSKDVNVNPVLMMENLLDWEHLPNIHAFKVISGSPKVDIQKNGLSGKVVYTYKTLSGKPFVVENMYWLPFTSILRFHFGNKRLVLFFTITPHTKEKCTISLQISRDFLKCSVFDIVFKLLDEMPLAEDLNIVKNVYFEDWGKNGLDNSDRYIMGYRKMLKLFFPDILSYYN